MSSSVSNYFYQGDYEDLLDWIIEAYPPKSYSREGFNAWLKDVKNNFLQDDKHFSDTIAEEMKQFWLENELGKLGIPPKEPEVRKEYVTFNSIRELGTFTVKDTYDYNEDKQSKYKDKKSFEGGLRRDLQKLVKQGKLERIRKGVYQVK